MLFSLRGIFYKIIGFLFVDDNCFSLSFRVQYSRASLAVYNYLIGHKTEGLYRHPKYIVLYG